tara:strand:+ start:1001 stop:1519 length:519 start_codon:yes stop_codon:yes gene_type:complete
MALSKIDVANMLTGVTPVANGGTALSSGFTNGKVIKVGYGQSTASTTLGQSYSSIINVNFTPLASDSTLHLHGSLQMYLNGNASYNSIVTARFLDDTASSTIQEAFDTYQGYGSSSTASRGNLFCPMFAVYASWGTSARDLKIDAKRPEAQGDGVINQYAGFSTFFIYEVAA